MANVSFGGGVDPSSTFAYLNRSYLESIDALAERASNRAQDRRSAEDSDMYDKYKNGLISDDQWLAYIAKRVQETKGDEKEHAQWVSTQREFKAAIADAKAEAKYEAGEISPQGLIDHYTNRLEGLKKNSPEYREVNQRIFALSDTIAQDDLWMGAQDITDRIAMGKASLNDLVTFYRGQLKNFRKNSDMYRQVEREIRTIQSQITTSGYSFSGGGGGGSGGGGSYKSVGSMSPQEAVGVATAGTLVDGNRYRGRNWEGVSRQARNFSGVLPGYTANETIDLFDALGVQVEQEMQTLFQQGYVTLADGSSTMDLTPDNMFSLYREFADLNEQEARAQEAKGDYSAAQRTRNARADIRGTYVVPTLALNFEQLLAEEVNDFMAVAEGIDEGDFSGFARAVGSTFGSPGFERRVTSYFEAVEKGRTVRPGVDDSREFYADRPAYMMPDDEMRQRVDNVMTWAQAVMSNDPAATASAGGLAASFGIPDVVVKKIQQYAEHDMSVKVGQSVKAWTPETGYTTIPTNTPVQPGMTWKTVYMDVGDGIEAVQIQFSRQAIQHPKFNGYVNANGQALPADMKSEDFNRGVQQGWIVQAPMAQAWQGVTPDGQRLYWVESLGPNGGFTTNPVSLFRTSSESKANAEEYGLSAFANSFAVGTAYIGNDPERFQRMIDRGEVQVSPLYRFDPSGTPTGELDDQRDVYAPNIATESARGFRIGMGWEAPERIDQERAAWFEKADARDAQDIGGMLRGAYNQTAHREDAFAVPGLLGIGSSESRLRTVDERAQEAFGDSAFGVSGIMSMAASLGINFGDPTAGRGPGDLISAGLARYNHRVTERESEAARFAKFAVVPPRPAARNSAPLIRLPTLHPQHRPDPRPTTRNTPRPTASTHPQNRPTTYTPPKPYTRPATTRRGGGGATLT